MTDSPIGEIVEAGTTAFVAQCIKVPNAPIPELHDPPALGAFVKIVQGRVPTLTLVGAEESLPSPLLGAGGLLDTEEDDPFAAPLLTQTAPENVRLSAATYALVYGASTTSLEPNRRPSALGFADEDELRMEQPQIFELLRTEFSGLLIAYSTGDEKGLRRHLPPTPPRIHSRVYPCRPEEVRALTEDLSFLRGVLLPSGGVLSGVSSDELIAACLRRAREVQHDDDKFLQDAGRMLAALLTEDYDRLRAILRAIL
jgi:hypothetical protein